MELVHSSLPDGVVSKVSLGRSSSHLRHVSILCRVAVSVPRAPGQVYRCDVPTRVCHLFPDTYECVAWSCRWVYACRHVHVTRVLRRRSMFAHVSLRVLRLRARLLLLDSGAWSGRVGGTTRRRGCRSPRRPVIVSVVHLEIDHLSVVE